MPTVYQMHRTLADLPTAPPPEGYAFRIYQDGDDKVWGDILNEAFSGHQAKMVNIEKNRPWGWRPEYTEFAVHADDEPVGVLTLYPRPEKEYAIDNCGQLGWLGVKPAHRRHGLARTLVLRLMHRLASYGRSSVMVVVGGGTPAPRLLYLSLGFEDDEEEAED